AISGPLALANGIHMEEAAGKVKITFTKPGIFVVDGRGIEVTQKYLDRRAKVMTYLPEIYRNLKDPNPATEIATIKNAQLLLKDFDDALEPNERARLEAFVKRVGERSYAEKQIAVGDKAIMITLPSKDVITYVPNQDLSQEDQIKMKNAGMSLTR